MKKTIGLMVVVLGFLPALALGGTFLADDEISINNGETVSDNLYVAGGNVSISDAVEGDVLAAGGQVLVAGDVSEDITLAGGNLTVLGNTGGDVRLAGGNILVTGTVGGDLVGVGGSLTIAPGVTVGRDLALVGGQISIDGDVAGFAELTGGVMTLNGRVGGDLVVRVDEQLTIGNGAVVEGDLEYYGTREDLLVVMDGATITGTVTFNESGPMGGIDREAAAAALFGGFVVFKFFASLVTALVLALLFKRFSHAVVHGVVRNPLKQLGVGFVTLIMVPVSAFLLFATLLGLPLGFMALLAYGLLLMLACAYGSIVVGSWVSKLVSKSEAPTVTWKNVILGVIILNLVTLIPVVGWLLGLLVFLMTLGSLTTLIYQSVWRNR